jgi:hypothetical protein
VTTDNEPLDWPRETDTLPEIPPGQWFEYTDYEGAIVTVTVAGDPNNPGIIVMADDGGCHIPLGSIESLVQAIRATARREMRNL